MCLFMRTGFLSVESKQLNRPSLKSQGVAKVRPYESIRQSAFIYKKTAMCLQTWNILSWTSVLCLTLSILGEGQRRRSQLWFRYIYSITDRKSASHPPSWVLERSEKPRAHRQQGLQLKSIIKSHPSLINVSLPSLQTQNDIQLRGFPVRSWVGLMNTLCTEFRWVNISTLPYSLIKQCVKCETCHLTAC